MVHNLESINKKMMRIELTKILACPKCNKQLVKEQNVYSCTCCNYTIKQVNGVWISPTTKKYHILQNFEGTKLRERTMVDFSTSKFENIIYKKILKKKIKSLPPQSVIIEIGAGDGRFTKDFLKDHLVISTDINHNALQRLKKHCGRNNNHMILCCSFEDMPIKKETVDCIIAIEVLHYANEAYEIILKNILNFLKWNGVFIESLPLKEAALLYSILNKDYLSAQNITKNKKKLETIGADMIPTRVFTTEEILSIYESYNLSLIKQYVTPEFISIMAMIYQQSTDNRKNLIINLASNLINDSTTYENGRCLISILKKIN
jgi:ubiquinone/menaquinone biosynthesis C-methylase UbiE/ribosomal protein L37AE/L43A